MDRQITDQLESIKQKIISKGRKSFKRFLILKDIETPRTHVLKLLCKMCENIDRSFVEIDEYCGNLTIYGVQSRYPFEMDITEADMKKAIVEADAVIDFVRKKMRSN